MFFHRAEDPRKRLLDGKLDVAMYTKILGVVAYGGNISKTHCQTKLAQSEHSFLLVYRVYM